MRTDTKIPIDAKKRDTRSAINCTPEKRGSPAIPMTTAQSRLSERSSVRPVRANRRNNVPNDAKTDNKSIESQLSMADCTKEAAGAAHELVDEVCYAIVAISRAVATLCRLSLRTVTLVLAVACLTLAIGVWACAMGKSVWSKMFA